jgi:trk system potassium uptake protein TrkA
LKYRKKSKKSILIIGMGRFGRHLALKLNELGNSVMVVDKDENSIQNMPIKFENVLIADCTNESVINSLGVSNFDLCFVSISVSFEAAFIITLLLKNYGAKYVITKASKEMQVDILKKVGADNVIYPEREFAEKIAIRYSYSKIHDYIAFDENNAIYEIDVPTDWIGQSIGYLDIRKKYNIKKKKKKSNSVLNSMPDVDYKFEPNDLVVLISSPEVVVNLSL